ncbi:ferredoxin [Amycolatopsis sp. H20-H5]|uniref:ferredoxin n=1 Tax=Amycolatopsis sp. H20-H5 TaxID=3046309 RepID=UPI002DB7F933|nr:ferredoxin [Amycolatopsis sp. H20-H5]MEC3979771.1 ferredoxin [Amycolatopsis sp. H20-H5]
MSWNVEVDENTCIGSGMCAALMPELFELEGATARALAEKIEPDETALDAADSCPAMAINVTDGSRLVGPRP